MKFKVVEELDESKRFQKVRGALFGDPTDRIRTFAIVTPENPLAWKDTSYENLLKKYNLWVGDKKKYNQEATKDFKQLIKTCFLERGQFALNYLGVQYVKIRGFYAEYETSYIIFNITKKDAEVIASAYGQESFFFGIVGKDSSKIGYYVTNDYGNSYKLVDITETVETVEDAQMFFSKFGIKWRFSMSAFGDDVPEVKNRGEFEESLSEERTAKSRALHRRNAYR